MLEDDDTNNGANTIIWTPDSRILLVQHNYGAHNWALPGGTVRIGEPPRDAAIRETREETGIVPLPELRPVALMAQRTIVHGKLQHGLCSIYSTPKYSGNAIHDNDEVSAVCFGKIADIFNGNIPVGLGYKRMVAIWLNTRHSHLLYEGTLADPVSTYIDQVLLV